MAELGVAAAIVGLTSAGVGLSSALYNICDTVVSAQDQIEDLASDLSFFTVIVDELGKIFALPDRVYSDNLVNSLSDILKRSKTLFQRIKRMICKTEKVPELQFRSKVAWIFREKKVKPIKTSLETTKATLSLMLQTLKFAQTQQQNDQEERKILANLLRSHQRSLDLLLAHEKNQTEQGPPPKSTKLNEQAGQEELPSLSSLISKVVPQPPEVPLSKIKRPPPKVAATSVAAAFNFGEGNLGSLYPIWKERVLDNVDVLVSLWTQAPPLAPTNSNPEVSTSASSPSEETLDALQELNDIGKEIKSLDDDRNSIKDENELLCERRMQIEEWLRRREDLGIKDKALQSLKEEIKVIQAKEADCRGAEEEFRARREVLLSQMKRAEELLEATIQASRPAFQWLDKDQQPVDSDSDTEGPHTADSHEGVPRFQRGAYGPPRSPGMRHHPPPPPPPPSGFKIPSDIPPPLPTAEIPTSSNFPRPSFHHSTSSGQTYPADTFQIPGSRVVDIITCQRQAWKQPAQFRGGPNDILHILRLVGYSPLWFTASQDAYNFHLGTTQPSFYTVELAPTDLSSHGTSKIEWTVIGKPWAHPEALKLKGLSYVEDSIGYMWIRKALNCFQIMRIFETSCDLLENALHGFSREVTEKRSTDELITKGKSHSKKPVSGKSDLKKGREIYEQHKAFFHENLKKKSRDRPRSGR